MTEKELKRLGRAELLELLIAQTKRAEGLERELAEANKKLENRLIVLSEAGNIARAALELNGVFDAAQAAADDYLDSVCAMSAPDPEIEKATLSAEDIIRNAEEKARCIISEAADEAARREASADAYWGVVARRIESIAKARPEVAVSLGVDFDGDIR